MRRTGIERIDHIKECIDKILQSTEEISKTTLEDDWILQAALVRWIEIIGEASKFVPDDIKEKHNEIPWREMAGMRDIAIHDYDDIDLEEIWNIIQRDIPLLKDQLSKIKRITEQ
jgi:uncharacterized protein with HEPN domain